MCCRKGSWAQSTRRRTMRRSGSRRPLRSVKIEQSSVGLQSNDDAGEPATPGGQKCDQKQRRLPASPAAVIRAGRARPCDRSGRPRHTGERGRRYSDSDQSSETAWRQQIHGRPTGGPLGSWLLGPGRLNRRCGFSFRYDTLQRSPTTGRWITGAELHRSLRFFGGFFLPAALRAEFIVARVRTPNFSDTS